MILKTKITIPFVKTTEDATLPRYSREGDAALDCYANKDVTIPPFTLENGLGRALVPLGFSMALPAGWVADIRPRSGLALKEGITILNTPGTIDENYRGEVGAIVVNTTTKPYEVKKGDKICQMLCWPMLGISENQGSADRAVEIIPTAMETLPESNRGSEGFGSSGK